MSGEPVVYGSVMKPDGSCKIEPLYTRPDELIEALMAANRYLINIGHDGSITGKLIRTALAKWDKP